MEYFEAKYHSSFVRTFKFFSGQINGIPGMLQEPNGHRHDRPLPILPLYRLKEPGGPTHSCRHGSNPHVDMRPKSSGGSNPGNLG